ncbi:MAG TPA: MBL fold metallo-hydrolase [Candidatus Hydrogenedentes bacterium]|nr:MBL fold metallo-hydrolase [Candidatus Hydrogenedentota bacterium]
MANWLSYTSTEGASPRPAAVIILYEQQRQRVLFVKRNPSLSFMGGHHAFPGGSLSDADTGSRVINAPDLRSARLLTTAVRELFEETGILLPDLTEAENGSLQSLREKTVSEPAVFEAFLEKKNIFIDYLNFSPAGRWVTPSFSPIRFDTSYFFCSTSKPCFAAPMGAHAEIVGVEWITPAEALKRRDGKSMHVSTPVVFVLQRLHTFPLPEALKRLRHTPGFSNTLLDYIEPFPGIHLVPLQSCTLPPATHTNCVLIGEESIYIVDPGASETSEISRLFTHIDEVCENVGGTPAGILLTHDHPDHCAAAEALSKRYNVTVYGHPASLGSFQNAEALEKGDFIEIPGSRPWSVRCLHTPGHHPGHLCYFEETTGTLLCGDTIANPGTIMINPDKHGDMGLYMAGLERLGKIPAALTVPGHGAPLMEGEGPAFFQKTLEHRIMRETKIKTAWEQGARSEAALLAEAYDDTPESMHPFALLQLRAHLSHLQETDLISF